MENKQSTLVEDEQPKSATEVVADVLAENTKKRTLKRTSSFRMWGSRLHVLDPRYKTLRYN